MSITDQPTPALPLDERIKLALDTWREHTDLALEAMAEAISLMTGTWNPSDVPEERFAGGVLPGDQVLWDDGWWNVDDVDRSQPITHAALTLTRVGRTPLELRLTSDQKLTTVRSS